MEEDVCGKWLLLVALVSPQKRWQNLEESERGAARLL